MKRSMEPELLAPAGTWDCARAAVANGADAIYFGMPRFNARMRAENFQEEDLPELMTFLHEHGVRGVVAFNTLIFPGELEAAVEQLVCLSDAGVDAVIVQDVGLARLVREVTPGVELHASTQMTITSPEGLALLDEAFVLDRAVLARENSLREIRLFHGNEPGSVPLETFVHGALCVAYSGQCLTSESLGQRSANRGECAQACRMTYDLIVDGELKELDDERYLLSPQDLAGYAEIPELLRLGVRTFKIEGRLKTPEYVAGVTRVYRQALDAALAKEEWSIRQEERYELEMAFSRGLSTGWLHGIDNQELVHGRYAKKRGAYLGEVTAVGPTWIRFRGSGQVRKGDGIVFDAGLDTEREEGGRIFDVEGDRLYFGREGGPNLDRVEAGHRLWKTDDPQLNRSWKKSWKGAKGTRKRYPVRWMLAGSEGKALRLRDEETKVEVTSAISLQVAQTKPLTAEVIEAKLGKLGSSTYVLERLTIEVEDGLILPVSELNRLRRKMVEQLDQVRERGPRQTQKVVWRELLPTREISPAEINGPVELSVLCRTEEQVEAVLQEGVGRCYVDLEDVRRYAGLVQRMRQEYGAEGKLFLATPRIQKAGETGLFRLIERAEPDGVLLRNLGGIAYFQEKDEFKRIGDFSLNVANPLSAEFFLDRGLENITISYDLNLGQVLDLLSEFDPSVFELTVHQHMPMFHMEHCVFCRFLSKGTDSTNCGRPCDAHEVKLRDRVGQEHVLAADVGCRNTLFNGRAQSGARHVPELLAAGLLQFRVEFLQETGREVAEMVASYRGLLGGEPEAMEWWAEQPWEARLGVTEGTLR